MASCFLSLGADKIGLASLIISHKTLKKQLAIKKFPIF
jgi:hypothetical protein